MMFTVISGGCVRTSWMKARLEERPRGQCREDVELRRKRMLPRRQGAEALFSTWLCSSRIWPMDLFYLACNLLFFFFFKVEIVANIEGSWISIFSRNLHSHVTYPAGAEMGCLQSLVWPLPASLS